MRYTVSFQPSTAGAKQFAATPPPGLARYVQYCSRPYPTDLEKLDAIDDGRGRADMPLQSPVVGLFRLRLV